jgi:hypothetical protein
MKLTANPKTSHCVTCISTVLLTADIRLIANGGTICDRNIVEKLCDWCRLQKAIGWYCHSHYVTPCRSLRVTRSLQHQDESDFCKLFHIESRFANNFATAVINIKVRKQQAVLGVPYWPQTITREDSVYIFWMGLNVKLSVCCLRSAHVLAHARHSRQHEEEVSPAVFTFIGRRNTTWVASNKRRKASQIQQPICMFLWICAKWWYPKSAFYVLNFVSPSGNRIRHTTRAKRGNSFWYLKLATKPVWLWYWLQYVWVCVFCVCFCVCVCVCVCV